MENSLKNSWLKEVGIIVALMFGYSMIYMDKTLISVAIVYIQSSFSFSDAEIGSIMSAFFLGYSIMQIPAGWLSDKFGAKKVILVSLILISICSVAFSMISFAPVGIAITLFLGIRFIQGVGHAGYPSSCSKSVAENFPKERRSFVQSMMLCTSGIGAVLAYTIGAYFAKKNWPSAYILLAIGFIISLVLVFFFLPKSEVSGEKKKTGDLLSLIKNPNVIILFIAMLLLNFQLYGNMSWLPKYLSQKFLLSTQDAALLLIPNAIVQTVATLVAGKLVSKFFLGKESWVVIGSAILSALFTVLFIFSSSIPLAITFMMLSTFCAITIFTTMFTWPHKLFASEQIGSSIGIVNTGGTFGGFLAPSILGVIIKGTEFFENQGMAAQQAIIESQRTYEMAFLLLAVATLASGLMVLLIRKNSNTIDTTL